MDNFFCPRVKKKKYFSIIAEAFGEFKKCPGPCERLLVGFQYLKRYLKRIWNVSLTLVKHIVWPSDLFRFAKLFGFFYFSKFNTARHFNNNSSLIRHANNNTASQSYRVRVVSWNLNYWILAKRFFSSKLHSSTCFPVEFFSVPRV